MNAILFPLLGDVVVTNIRTRDFVQFTRRTVTLISTNGLVQCTVFVH